MQIYRAGAGRIGSAALFLALVAAGPAARPSPEKSRANANFSSLRFG